MDVPNHIIGRNSESNFNLRFKSVLDNFWTLRGFKGTSSSSKIKHISRCCKINTEGFLECSDLEEDSWF